VLSSAVICNYCSAANYGTAALRYTYRAARTAAGTAAELARQLVTGQASNGMALIRPAGHVAGVGLGEAGNYLNNAAVAVKAAQAAGARRVMVIDW
jgi:histone deacetylase 6